MNERELINKSSQIVSGNKTNKSKNIVSNTSNLIETHNMGTIQAKLDIKMLSHKDVMQLQRTIGNKATTQLLKDQMNTNSNIQKTESNTNDLTNEVVQKKENNTGLPDNLKSGVESQSGMSMDDVRVHYNSDKPKQLGALAYTKGTEIHVGPGQEKHLSHELGHVVQQKQGIVKPTTKVNGVDVNDDESLEREADTLHIKSDRSNNDTNNTVQCMNQKNKQKEPLAERFKKIFDTIEINNDEAFNKAYNDIYIKTQEYDANKTIETIYSILEDISKLEIEKTLKDKFKEEATKEIVLVVKQDLSYMEDFHTASKDDYDEAVEARVITKEQVPDKPTDKILDEFHNRIIDFISKLSTLATGKKLLKYIYLSEHTVFIAPTAQLFGVEENGEVQINFDIEKFGGMENGFIVFVHELIHALHSIYEVKATEETRTKLKISYEEVLRLNNIDNNEVLALGKQILWDNNNVFKYYLGTSNKQALALGKRAILDKYGHKGQDEENLIMTIKEFINKDQKSQNKKYTGARPDDVPTMGIDKVVDYKENIKAIEDITENQIREELSADLNKNIPQRIKY